MAEKDEIFSELDQSGEIIDKVFNEDIILDFDFTKYTFKKQRRLVFKNVTFNGKFNFINFSSDHLQRIEFEECIFLNDVIFKNISALNLYFLISNCTFYPKFQLLLIDFKIRILELNKNEMEICKLKDIVSSDLQINNCSVKKYLSLYDIVCDYAELINDGGKVFNRIIMNSPKIKRIIIQAQDIINSLLISEIQIAFISGDFNKISISASDFTSIEISNLTGKGYTNKPAKIGEIKFQDTNFKGLLTLEDLEIENLVFAGLNMSNGSVRFNEITINDTSIYDCTISNFYWNQVKFINPPEIIRSDVSDLKMANVFWQNDKRLKNSFLGEKIAPLYGLRKKWLKKSSKDFDYENISELKYQIETYRLEFLQKM
jgi:hypothetical protein